MNFEASDLIVGILIIAVIICSYFSAVFILRKHFKSALQNLKFVFKWFLIGKIHCDVGAKTKRALRVLHKIFWAGTLAGWGFAIAWFFCFIEGVLRHLAY